MLAEAQVRDIRGVIRNKGTIVMANITYEIVEHIGIISENATSGWKKELNLISWNNGNPKYDIRDWAPNHEKMGKGVTLTDEELQALYGLIDTL